MQETVANLILKAYYLNKIIIFQIRTIKVMTDWLRRAQEPSK
jgi:hypothetical protein